MVRSALKKALDTLDGVPAQTRVEVIRGVTVRKKKNGLVVMSLHYSAIPERDPETPAGAKWYERESSSYASKAMWKKEQEMDAYATGGEAVFGSILSNHELYETVVISDPNWYPGPPYMAANPDVVAGFDHGVTNATALLKGYVPKKSIDPKTGAENPVELYMAGEFYRYRSDDWQNNVDENVKVMKKMPDLERARWIKADPSIFYDAVAQDKGAPTNIYQTYKKNNMWKMTPYDGVRSDVTFVEWIMADWWRGIATLEGKPTGKKPRLYIVCRTPSDRPQPGLHEFDCPNLLWEMKRAKRVEMTSRQLLTRNPSEALQNKNNHALDCLVGGTLVTTRTGEVPIERVAPGQEVMTRKGWRSVTASWLANPASEVYRVTFSNGAEVIGTAGHRFFIESKGFLRLDELNVGMMALATNPKFVVEGNMAWATQRSQVVEGMRLRTAVGLRERRHKGCERNDMGHVRITPQFTFPFSAKKTYIFIASQCSATLARPLRAVRSAASAMPMWAALTTEIICKSLESAFIPAESRILLADPSFVPPSAVLAFERYSDFSARKRAKVSPVGDASCYSKFLTAVGAFFKDGFLFARARTVLSSLFQPRRPRQVCASASFANRLYLRHDSYYHADKDTQNKFLRVVITQIQRLPGVRPTYDLTVDGEHEFFANGVLVHNCFKAVLGTLRNSAAIDPNEAVEAAIQGLDPFAAQLTSKWIMSKLARDGKLGPDGRPAKSGKGVQRIDLRRTPGVLGR